MNPISKALGFASLGWFVSLGTHAQEATTFFANVRIFDGKSAMLSALTNGRLPGAITRSGELEVPAPVDNVTWTDQVSNFGHRSDLGDSPKVLVHTGLFSPITQNSIIECGWKAVAMAYPTR